MKIKTLLFCCSKCIHICICETVCSVCQRTYISFNRCSLPLCMLLCSISQMVAHWQCLLRKNCFNSINLFKCEIFSTIESTLHTSAYMQIDFGDFHGCLYLDNIPSISRSRLPTPPSISSISYALYQQRLAPMGISNSILFPEFFLYCSIHTDVVESNSDVSSIATNWKNGSFFYCSPCYSLNWKQKQKQIKHNTTFYDWVLCPLWTIAHRLIS